MTHISMFDIISLALVLILGIKGIINGFVKEVFGLLGIIGGVFFRIPLCSGGRRTY
ncbi:MAG: CvpA family protein [Sulfurospirillum sp.]|nr:CvpA family protein [Sulfurospirillum sp.]